MSDQAQMDVSTATPPDDFSTPLKALWWLKKGDMKLGAEWEKAHNICQSAEGDKTHDWIHGLCHLIEGDHGNASYWFRRAGKPSDNRDTLKIWEDIAIALR
ncbi:MAG: hypothetical protein ABJN98_05775 [Roseibium sp.]